MKINLINMVIQLSRRGAFDGLLVDDKGSSVDAVSALDELIMEYAKVRNGGESSLVVVPAEFEGEISEARKDENRLKFLIENFPYNLIKKAYQSQTVMSEEEGELRFLLIDMRDSSECRLHGTDCQTHGWLGGHTECPQKRLKEIMGKMGL
jgi:hypothetical protein